jgi:hypothetical protein
MFFQVLDLMKEVAEEASEDLLDGNESGSDYSGYHSDSDSTVMMSGNSPFISKSARYNFLSRSGNYEMTSYLPKHLETEFDGHCA